MTALAQADLDAAQTAVVAIMAGASAQEAIASAIAAGRAKERERCAAEVERRVIEYTGLDVLEATPECDRIARRIRGLE